MNKQINDNMDNSFVHLWCHVISHNDTSVKLTQNRIGTKSQKKIKLGDQKLLFLNTGTKNAFRLNIN
jgi:hypothetical protein